MAAEPVGVGQRPVDVDQDRRRPPAQIGLLRLREAVRFHDPEAVVLELRQEIRGQGFGLPDD